VFPSTVAYMARLLIHRFDMLGILDDEGLPVDPVGIVANDEAEVVAPKLHAVGAMESGKACKECGSYTLIRKDGCDFCTACGATGSCG